MKLTGSERGSDCSGHGTHVASLVGGLTSGVAKNVNLKAVRVLACDGSTSASAMVEALEWLRTNVQRPAVSIVAVSQTGSIPSLEQAVER
ncbi:MAG: S8 family serine peptidase [Akkermansiaceae bacterium]|nr:S8 family serine peptidase [Akkermansiaceae bacterium]